MSAEYKHITVLLNEAVDTLVEDPDGFYIDGTFGRGGHSELVLSRLSEQGQLMGIDKDPEAIACAAERFGDDPRFSIERGSFAQLEEFVRRRELAGRVDRDRLDLGVSSPPLEGPTRGFSFTSAGPLRLRSHLVVGYIA